MKRIQTREKIEKRDRINKTIIGVVLVSIMVLSIAGYSFFGSTSRNGATRKASYNGYEFELNENGLWQTKIESYKFMFQYLPNETEDVKTSLNMNLNNYANRELYFVSDNTAATREIAQNLIYFLPRIPQEACLDENCTLDAPIKNCSSNLIIIKEGDVEGVSQEDSCIFISGNYSELVRISDEFLYKILGVK